jgi:hypothetical protein
MKRQLSTQESSMQTRAPQWFSTNALQPKANFEAVKRPVSHITILDERQDSYSSESQDDALVRYDEPFA